MAKSKDQSVLHRETKIEPEKMKLIILGDLQKSSQLDRANVNMNYLHECEPIYMNMNRRRDAERW